MDRFFKYLISFLIITQNISCQNMKEELPEFHVQMSHSSNDHLVDIVRDEIKTLEGVYASFPYGGTSGFWGDSGKSWTAQNGTPIGVDVTYYAAYEDKFYRLNVDFPIDTIKDYMERAYCTTDLPKSTEVLEEYKRLGRGHTSDSFTNKAYDSFSDIIFGFAPKGMVVVWLSFGGLRHELGRYQAEVLKEDAKLTQWAEKKYSVSRKKLLEMSYLPDASPLKWDNYRLKFDWYPTVLHNNPKFRLLYLYNLSYNEEDESMYRPWVLNPPKRKRAIPREIDFIWTTAKGEQFVSAIFFSWDDVLEDFKQASKPACLEFKISDDNSSIEVLLNKKPLKTDSIRIFNYDRTDRFRDLYKE